MAVAVLVTCSSCAAENPSVEPSAVASSTSSGTAAPSPLPCVPGAEPFTGPAAEELGADRVMAAYCSVADFVLDHAFTSLALPGGGGSTADYAFVREHLSPSGRHRWDAAVRRFLESGDQRAAAVIDALTLHAFGSAPAGFEIPTEGPYAYGTEVGPAEAVVRRGGLTIGIEVSTELVLEERGDDSGRHSLLALDRTLAVRLVPAPDDSDRWLVDRWRGTTATGKVRLATGG